MSPLTDVNRKPERKFYKKIKIKVFLHVSGFEFASRSDYIKARKKNTKLQLEKSDGKNFNINNLPLTCASKEPEILFDTMFGRM